MHQHGETLWNNNGTQPQIRTVIGFAAQRRARAIGSTGRGTARRVAAYFIAIGHQSLRCRPSQFWCVWIDTYWLATYSSGALLGTKHTSAARQ